MKNQQNLDWEYQTILNNLLNISNKDTSLFVKVDNDKLFDLYSTFNLDVIREITYQNNFSIRIRAEYLNEIIQKLNNIYLPLELIEYLKKINYINLAKREKFIYQDFEKEKKQIISEYNAKLQQFNSIFKKYYQEILSIYEQTSSWPLYVGCVFVKVHLKEKNKKIYAPLFLKPVDLDFNNGIIKLISNGDLKLNEKLLFVLKNEGFDLHIDEELNDDQQNIFQLIKLLKQKWENSFYNFDIKLENPIKNFEEEEIQNQELEFHDGMVLGIFQPSGGYLRNRMLEIIKNKELENILVAEFDKNIYKKNIQEVISNPKTRLLKISPTNYSQDKAIISALKQNTIIWGPPGTGKSQTIVNILVNILFYNKTALVSSEKKAALEVIKERLGILKQYALVLSNPVGNNSKSKFYHPLKIYIGYLENFEKNNTLSKPKINIVDESEINFVENLKKWKSEIKFDKYLEFIGKTKTILDLLTEEQFKILIKLDSELLYTVNLKYKNSKKYLKELLKLNKLKFKFFNKKYKFLKNNSTELFDKFNNFNINFNELKSIVNTFDFDDWNIIKSIYGTLPNNNSQKTVNIDWINQTVAERIIEKINKIDKNRLNNFSAIVKNAKMKPHKFIKEYSDIIKIFFPIIIATPEMDLSIWKKEEFDYAIIDEASQMFNEKGLPLLYLAKNKILAGDNQQMKPSNWFNTRFVEEDSVYAGIDSILDHAEKFGIHSILLDKNYRSNFASLMTFSSKHFYDENLDVIDLYNNNFSKEINCAIETINVEGIWENNTNNLEIDIAIKTLENNIDSYEKIILLSFNKFQRDKLENIIINSNEKLRKKIESNNLLIRNIENIQGDEADLVIASVAYDKNATIHSTYVGRIGGKNALNVAITRAKEKMIVIKSIYASDIIINSWDNEDLLIFKKWLEFLDLSEEEKKKYINPKNRNNNFSMSQLQNKIYEELEKYLNNSSILELTNNENIGTITIDIALKVNNKIHTCFIIDNFEYDTLEDYLKFNDKIKFIRNKKYPVFVINAIIWEEIKFDIFDYLAKLIEELTTDSNIEKSLLIKTNHEINDYEQLLVDDYSTNASEIKILNKKTNSLAITNNNEFDNE
ncbi:ATP-binding protein [Mycoplasma sp. 1018B]|uniref:DEAD/DEAH box helicase n=1 Tax=Mycoplasma sp. 1018B TaxID=2967302 RepID=UPI00211BCB4A|nr:AAA domain-containing protein [Mycoplasma sp. 1018B]UUM19066.1 AAA domain-containing protein [Mycoplasma sp. 1018B]